MKDQSYWCGKSRQPLEGLDRFGMILVISWVSWQIRPRVFTVDGDPVLLNDGDVIVIGTQRHSVPKMPEVEDRLHTYLMYLICMTHLQTLFVQLRRFYQQVSNCGWTVGICFEICELWDLWHQWPLGLFLILFISNLHLLFVVENRSALRKDGRVSVAIFWYPESRGGLTEMIIR